jgi:hypothetical protein
VFAEAWHRDAQTQFKEFGPSSGLVIESQEPIQTESNLSVLGVLRNDGANAWQFIRFQISLRGAQGGIVGICEDSAMAPVYPGQKRTFQLNCRGIPEYKTYTLEIVNASYVRGGT